MAQVQFLHLPHLCPAYHYSLQGSVTAHSEISLDTGRTPRDIIVSLRGPAIPIQF